MPRRSDRPRFSVRPRAPARPRRDGYALRMLAAIAQVVLGLFLVPVAIFKAAGAYGWPGGLLAALVLIPFWRALGDLLNPDVTEAPNLRRFLASLAMAFLFMLATPVALLFFGLEGLGRRGTFGALLLAVATSTWAVAVELRLAPPTAVAPALAACAAWALFGLSWLATGSDGRGPRATRLAQWYRCQLEALERRAR